MQGVGTTSLGPVRRPGAAVATLALDVAALVGARLWRLARDAAVALRRRAPYRTVPNAAQLVTFDAQAALVGSRPRLVAHGPTVGYSGNGRGALLQRELTLPADPTAPRRARVLLQAAAQEWGVDDDLHQDAATVVTELVANAVDHARTPSVLTVELDERGDLCLAVRDAVPGPVPRPRPVDPAAPRGRGLQMVSALASSWGVTTHLDGKTVWAVLPRAAAERANGLLSQCERASGPVSQGRDDAPTERREAGP